MASNHGLASTASPRSVRLGGGRRLNHLPLYVAGSVALGFVGLVCYVAAERGHQQTKPKEDDHGGSAVSLAQNMTGDRTGGLVAKATPPVLPTITPLPVVTQAVTPPVQPEAAPVTAPPAPDERLKQRLAAYEAAIRAKAGVDNGEFQQVVQQRQQLEAQKVAALQRVDPNNAQDALQGYQRQLAQAQAMVGAQPGANGTERNPNDLAAFSGSKDRFTLPSRLERPATPYVLQTGSVIPAVVITGMDSDLPGAITAQVSQNVYDTPSGDYLLIPQGTRLFGEYASQVAYGQSRIFVAWERLIYPNGSTLDLGAMPGADEQGMAGFHDRVDAHLVRTFGSAVLMSAITAGFTWGQGRNTGGGAYGNNGVSASDALSQALGQNLGTAASQLLEKNLNVAPTLRIRAGFRFNVVVCKDITLLSEYHVTDY